MRFSSLKVCFLIAFSFFSSLDSFAQTTIDFNTLGDGLLTTSYSSGGFTFSINATNGRVIQSKATGGFSNSPTLYDNNPDIGAITRWTITKNDGAEFQFRSVYLRDAGFGASTSGTIQGFKNGTSTGSAEAITFGGTVELAGNSKFFDVDELRIQGSDINFFLDHFTYGSVFVPVDTDPTQVSSISVQGTPGPFATLVTYAVNFNKAALNVSIDDFQLTTTGSVSGTIASVSGSGSGYTVTVNNITGEGTLRLDLKSGTNITNTNGNTGTIAFASGSAHILSACVIETFESTVFIDAATSFSSNGRSFTLGTGLEIEDRRGFGAVNPGESGNSNKYIKNNNTSGSFTLSGAQDFTMNTIDVFLSNLSNGDNPTGVGSLIIRGKKDGTTLYTITKTSGFPTTSSNGNGGFFTINFATSGLGNYRNITIDQLEFTIADGFVALALDNFNFCHLAPDIDILAPKVISSIPDGAAFSNATSVNFEVVFDENAFNVSTDDFALATSGTATGTISAVSGNGSVYTVAVSGITGEGTLKVNLSAPNNIRDVLNNTGSPAFASGQEHLVGSCFIENFEDETSGATSFSGNGSNFTLVGNWSVNKEVPSTGIGGSKINLKHTGAGPYSIVSGDGLITVSRLALYLSSFASGTTPTNDGSVTIKGFNNNVEEFSVIKFSGFPTDFSSNNGYFFVNFATEQGQDNSKKLIDKLEITLGGSFVYLNLENFEWCTDILPPSDYSVTIDQDLINVGNQNAVSFTFAGAEIGTTYNYTLSSSGGGTNVTGSGLVSSATQQIAPIDLNGLGDGTITLSVTLTDAFSNVGDPATDTSTKLLNTVPIATAPSVPVVNEDDVNVALSDEIQISDAENDDQTVIFTITGGTLEIGVAGITFGSGTNGSASFTASGTLAAINTALDAATFTPTPDLFGATAGGISFTADDGIATSDPAAVTFEIIGVNDDPTFVGLPASITVVEDADIAYLSNALSDATFADVDAGNNTVMLILSVSAGTLNFANPQGVITITGFGTPTAHLIGTVANLEAYLSINTNAAYFPPLNLSGANAATLTVSANDGGHTGVGGGATVELGQIQIDITAVNDAPTVANPIPDQNATSGVAFNFQFAANAFNDVDADDVLTYTAQLNGGGALPAWLSFDAGTRTFSGTFGIDDAGSLSIEVIADDGNGGTVSDVFALTIEAVNGPPVISIPSAQTMNQNNVLVLSLGNGNQVSISDVDAGSHEVEISLTVTNGLITLASTTGLSFLAGDGAADQTMTFFGSIANINNALDGMNYSPSDGYNGPASLSVLVNDQGWTGSGGEQVASDVLHILVNSVNPVVTGVSSAVADGFYKIGDVIPILVSFDQAVDVSGGNPRLVLETGTVDRQAVYESGSGSNTLTFNYEVQSGDQTDDLDYQSTGSLVLSGATIQNQQGDDAILTLPGVGTPASLSGQAGLVIDGIRPEVTITLSRTELKVDEYLPVTFTFSEVVYGYDNADLTVENGTLSSVSSEDGGLTWTANLFPNANVEQASNLIALDNSGYRDYAGNTGTGVTVSPNYSVDTKRPTVEIVVDDTELIVGETTMVTFTFSEMVTGFSNALLTVGNGSLSLVSSLDEGATWTAWLTPDDGVEVANNVIIVDNTGYADPAGNQGSGTTESNNYLIDNVAPTVSTQNITVQLDNNGTVGITPPQIHNNSTDGFPITSLTLSQTDFDCSHVGANTVTLTVTDANGNSASADATVTVVDNTAPTVKTQDITVYLEAVGALPVSANDVDNGSSDNCGLASFSLSKSVFGSSDIGENTVTLTVTDENENQASETAIVTVVPLEITELTFEDASFVYDGTAKSLSITGTLPAGTSVAYTDNSRTDVGTQKVTATITGDNFTTLELTANLTITPADFEGIEFNDASFVYDGTARSLAVTGTLPEGTSAAYSNNSRTDVGTQVVTATVTGDNFTTLELTANLTVTPAPITGIGFEGASFTYDGTAKSLSVTGTLPAGTSVVYSNNSRTGVGSQKVTVTVTGDNFTTLVLTANLTVSPADYEGVEFNDASFVYDGTARSLSITGTLPEGTAVAYTDNSRTDVGTQEVTATITGDNFTTLELTANLTITPAPITGIGFEGASFIYDGTAKSLAITGTLPAGTSVAYSNNSRTDVGTQIVTATVTGGNFTTLELTANLTITPATITGIGFEGASFTYDGTAKSLSITGTLPAGTSVVYSNNSRTEVGTQEVTATITGENFTTLELTANLTITPATITGIAFDGASFTYDGTARSLAVTGTLPEGTSVVYSNNSRTDVGTQKVTATVTGDNYGELVLSAELEITPATITGIGFEGASFTYDGTAKSLSVTGTLPAGTSVVYSNNSRTDVGTQIVTATVTGDNYGELVLSAELEITPAPITGIGFEGASFTYDGTARSLSISGTLPPGASVVYSNNSRTDVGTQKVTATVTGDNYDELTLTAQLEITPATITGVGFEGASFIYDGTAKSLSVTGTLPAGTSVVYSNNSRTDVGTQEVTATVTGDNFTTLELTANLTITPATLNLTVDAGQRKMFGEADPELTYTATGFAAGEDNGVLTGRLDRVAGENIGYYPITIGTLDAGPNYTINYVGAEFEIFSNDTDGDKVPDEVEIVEGTDPSDPDDYKDSDGDGVPDFVETDKATDPADPSDYPDSDSDQVPDYVEEREGTDPDNGEGYRDEDKDGVPDYIQDRAVTEFIALSMEAVWGTAFEALVLPTEVLGITGRDEFINLAVDWDLTAYDPLRVGLTVYEGTAEIPEGVFNPHGLTPTLSITILEKPTPEEVLLSKNEFVGIPDQYFQEVGVFTVVDPSDDIHTLSLPEGEGDNAFFEVSSGSLFWNSADQQSGRVDFTVIILVQDRAGNELRKSFAIRRLRTPLDELDVPNTFTPNDDGVNDTWGVPALRYYTGVRIQVLDNGGNRLFYTEDPDVEWNGTFKGKQQPTSSYVYVIEVGETGEVRRGMLNLLRQ